MTTESPTPAHQQEARDWPSLDTAKADFTFVELWARGAQVERRLEIALRELNEAKVLLHNQAQAVIALNAASERGQRSVEQAFNDWLAKRPGFREQASGTELANLRTAFGEGARITPSAREHRNDTERMDWHGSDGRVCLSSDDGEPRRAEVRRGTGEVMSSTPAREPVPDEAAWEICRNIRTDPGREGICEKCPALVETSYGAGTQMCRTLAETAFEIARRFTRSESGHFTPLSTSTAIPTISDAPSASAPRLNPEVLPALPGQKVITVLMLKDDGDKQADATIKAIQDGTSTFLVQDPGELFFHQLRLRVAQDPALADKIAVYYLQPDTRQWEAVPFATKGDELRWPVGFLHDAWEKETQIMEVRHATDRRKAND